jgi:hypothetical protein
MKYLFLKEKRVKDIYDDMSFTLGDKCPSTIKNGIARFRKGHLCTEDECSGRPTELTIPENVAAIHSMIIDDRRIYAKMIAETLVISQGGIGYIIHEIVDMRKLSAKWVPKCLNADQKCDQVLASQAILDLFWQDPGGFFNYLVTMDET